MKKKKTLKQKYWICEDGHYTGICKSEKRPWMSEGNGYLSFKEAKLTLIKFFKDRRDGWDHYYKKAKSLKDRDVPKIPAP
jgi:hypothetical protein